MMGMYSSFRLDLYGAMGKDKEIFLDFKAKSDGADYSLDEFGEPQQDNKWYDCDTDLKEFSCLYPNVVFVLTAEGEDNNFYKHYAAKGVLETVKGEIKYPSPKNDLFKGVV